MSYATQNTESSAVQSGNQVLGQPDKTRIVVTGRFAAKEDAQQAINTLEYFGFDSEFMTAVEMDTATPDFTNSIYGAEPDATLVAYCPTWSGHGGNFQIDREDAQPVTAVAECVAAVTVENSRQEAAAMAILDDLGASRLGKTSGRIISGQWQGA